MVRLASLFDPGLRSIVGDLGIQNSSRSTRRAHSAGSRGR